MNEKDVQQLKASFPHAKLATDKEILEFGAQFIADYRLRMIRELDELNTAVELQMSLAGVSEPPSQLRLAIELRAGLIDTLERLAHTMKGKANGITNTSGISGTTEN